MEKKKVIKGIFNAAFMRSVGDVMYSIYCASAFTDNKRVLDVLQSCHENLTKVIAEENEKAL